jgi:hypothetical protein
MMKTFIPRDFQNVLFSIVNVHCIPVQYVIFTGVQDEILLAFKDFYDITKGQSNAVSVSQKRGKKVQSFLSKRLHLLPPFLSDESYTELNTVN